MITITKLGNCYSISNNEHIFLIDFNGQILNYINQEVWNNNKETVIKSITLYENGYCPNCGRKIVFKKYAGSCDICTLEYQVQNQKISSL